MMTMSENKLRDDIEKLREEIKTLHTKEGDEEKYLKLPELNQTSFGLLLGVGIGIIAITL